MVRPWHWASFYHHRSALNILFTVDSLVSYLPCQYCRHRRACPQKEVRSDAHPPGGRIGFGSKALEVKWTVQSTRCKSTLCVSGEFFRGKWNTHFILLHSTSSGWLLSLAPHSIPCRISHLFFDGYRPNRGTRELPCPEVAEVKRRIPPVFHHSSFHLFASPSLHLYSPHLSFVCVCCVYALNEKKDIWDFFLDSV